MNPQQQLAQPYKKSKLEKKKNPSRQTKSSIQRHLSPCLSELRRVTENLTVSRGHPSSQQEFPFKKSHFAASPLSLPSTSAQEDFSYKYFPSARLFSEPLKTPEKRLRFIAPFNILLLRKFWEAVNEKKRLFRLIKRMFVGGMDFQGISSSFVV